MVARRAAVIIVPVGIIVVAVVLVSAGSSTAPPSRATTDRHPTVPTEPTPQFGGALENCSSRSEALFPGAFSDPENLVVGPLVLVGGAYTPASTVYEFGGNKFPLLVTAGHTVTVRIGRGARRAGLAYGPLPQGRETRLRDTYRSVTFAACRPGKRSRRYSISGPSGSYADRTNVTFWSGFVLTRTPACVPLEIYVDGATAPIYAGLSLGRHCGR
jgi:hypothetical protein